MAKAVHGVVVVLTIGVSAALQKARLLKSYPVQRTPSGPNRLGITRLANCLGRQQ